jgi:hypothetical protein
VQAHSSAVDLRDPNDQKDELDLDYFPETTATERACIEIELDDLELLHALPPDVQLDCNSVTTLLRLYLNLSVLLNSLPPQSPNRKELYRYLSDGLSTETATKWLQTSRATIYRSRQSTEEDGTLSLNAIGYKRPRKVSNLDEMHIAFDELCPIQSGRDYRIKSASTQIMFKRYREIAKEPMGRTAFYNMMAAARVRKVVQTQCPHCIEFKNLNSLPMPLTEEQCMIWEKKSLHSRIWGPQRAAYSKEKVYCQSHPKSVLIVMDFAKIDVYHHSFQILHIIYYFCGEAGQPERKLDSYIGQVAESNDVYFVINTFLQFVIPTIVQHQWRYVRFYSDGGGKHFKCSPFIYFLWTVWNTYKSIDIEYHFFASYHGCNGCDGAAAQAAAKVRSYQEESGVYPRDAAELKEILDGLQKHNYTIIQRIERQANKKPKDCIDIAVYKGIRSFHHFQFSAEEQVTGFESSSTEWNPNRIKVWKKSPKKFPKYQFPLLRLFQPE